MSNSSHVPSGWESAKFGDVCKVQRGFAFKSSNYMTDGIPLVRIGNLNNGKVELSNAVLLPDAFKDTYSQFLLQKGDVLIAMSGATTGKMAVYDCDSAALLNQRVGRFQFKGHDVIYSRFTQLLVERIKQEVETTA